MSTGTVLVAGLTLPRTVHITETDGAGSRVSVHAEYSDTEGRYVPTSVAVDAPGGEVTGVLLRNLPIHSLVRRGVVTALGMSFADWPGPPEDAAEDGPSRQALRWVADTYKVALTFGENPIDSVKERMRIPRSTASRWVTRAKDRGYLDVCDRRGARREP